MNTFREDIDNDPERDASIVQRIIQYTTQSIIEARARKVQDRNRDTPSQPQSSMTDLEASVLARKLSKKRLSSLSGTPEHSNTIPERFAENFHPAIQEILPSPVGENSTRLSESGAQSSRPPSSHNSPAQLRPMSSHELPIQSRPTSSHSSSSNSSPISSRKSPNLRSRPRSKVLGVVGDIEWYEVV
jgi:hypothetical protein